MTTAQIERVLESEDRRVRVGDRDAFLGGVARFMKDDGSYAEVAWVIFEDDTDAAVLFADLKQVK